MARSAPASNRDSSRPMIPCRKQQLRPDTPNLQAVPAGEAHVEGRERASTPRRKNKPHSEGHSRSEWLADHGPLERLGEGAVEVGDEGFDARLQVLLRGEAGAAQQLAHEDGEPDLDLVQLAAC